MKSTWTQRAMVGVFALSLGVVVACGSSKPPAAGDGTVNLNDGTCNTEGVTRECHFTVPQPGMLVCGTGAQTCTGGTWSACGGDVKTNHYAAYPGIIYDPAAPAGKQLGIDQQIMPQVLVTTPPINCLNNPCDPNCLAITIPSLQLCGFISEKPNESYKDLTAAFQFPRTCTYGVGADNCGYDSSCRSDNTCKSNGKATTCSGQPDFTVGPSCNPKQPGAPNAVPICNRGDTDASSGILKIAWSSTATNLSTCGNLTTTKSCQIDLSIQPIKANQCVDIDAASCPGLPTSGNIMMRVNDNGAGVAGAIPECNLCNNWSAVDMGTGRECALSCNTKDANGNDVNYNALPGGFQNNPATCTVEDPLTTTVAGTPVGTDPTLAPPADGCNYDFKCAGGTCTGFNDGEQGHCQGPDLTGGVACKDGDNKLRFRLCNRGTVAINQTIQIGLDTGVSDPLYCTAAMLTASGGVANVGTSAPINGGLCGMNADLKPGECKTFDSDGCPAGFQDNGNRMIFIDATDAVAECDECNNWTAYANTVNCGNNAAATTTSVQVPSSCPPGYIAQWGKLFYATTTPGGSSVVFQAQTGTTPTGPWVPAAPVTVASIPSPDAQICATACASGSCSGPYQAPFTLISGTTNAVCPKDMTAPLGLNAKNQYLNLTVTLTSSKGNDDTKIPTINAPPQVIFDCVPNE